MAASITPVVIDLSPSLEQHLIPQSHSEWVHFSLWCLWIYGLCAGHGVLL